MAGILNEILIKIGNRIIDYGEFRIKFEHTVIFLKFKTDKRTINLEIAELDDCIEVELVLYIPGCKYSNSYPCIMCESIKSYLMERLQAEPNMLEDDFINLLTEIGKILNIRISNLLDMPLSFSHGKR